MEDKELTQKQNEAVVNHIIKLVKSGYLFKQTDEHKLTLKTDEHICVVNMSVFGDGKKIYRFDVINKNTQSKLKVEYGKVEHMTDLDIIQNQVNRIINANAPGTYSDDEVFDLLGGDELVKRSKKIKRIKNNISVKTSADVSNKSIFSRFKTKKK